MLVARRDPPFHVDAKDAAPLNPHVYPPPRASRTARVLTAMQLIGSLLAVPVGIASAYSFYRANFAPETTCQNLRSGIISLLDKSVDASTRRMLVRRDVEEFEKACAAVDPDATAAFKSLLAAEKTAAPAVAPAPAAPKVQRTETRAAEGGRPQARATAAGDCEAADNKSNDRQSSPKSRSKSLSLSRLLRLLPSRPSEILASLTLSGSTQSGRRL